jgi:hypothetical protein
MTGMESIMIRSLSSVGFIPEKEDMLMNPTAVGRLLLGWACSDYLEVAPFGPARPVRATARIPRVGNAWSSAQHLLSGRQEILCPRNFAILRRKGFGEEAHETPTLREYSEFAAGTKDVHAPARACTNPIAGSASVPCIRLEIGAGRRPQNLVRVGSRP